MVAVSDEREVLKNTNFFGNLQVFNHRASSFFENSLSRGRSELGHSLGALGHSMLGEFTGKHKTNSGLDLSGRKSRLLVVTSKTGSLGGDAVEDVVDEGVHDGHATLGDTGVIVHLLQHLVDVRGVGFHSLLVSGASGLLGSLHALLSWSLCHFDKLRNLVKNCE